VKDLPDIALLATIKPLEARRLRAALEQTFESRKTQSLPGVLPPPPPAWGAPYAAMAREDQLPWKQLADVTAAAQAFLNPVLGSRIDSAWQPGNWHWR